MVDVVINPCDGPDFISKAVGTEGIHIRCGMVSLVAVDHNVILTTDVIEDLSQLPVASVCNMQVYVDEVNECDDNSEVNDVDADDEVSGRVHNRDYIVSSDCVNDDDVLRPLHTVDDGVSASDVKDEFKVRCGVGDDNVDDNLVCVHTVDVMTDECVDESDGLDGRMNDCLSNCCRDISSYLMWLILCIIFVTAAVCDALLDPVPHIRVRSMGIGDNECNFVGQLTYKTDEVQWLQHSVHSIRISSGSQSGIAVWGRQSTVVATG